MSQPTAANVEDVRAHPEAAARRIYELFECWRDAEKRAREAVAALERQDVAPPVPI